jgi:hypothetical protein
MFSNVTAQAFFSVDLHVKSMLVLIRNEGGTWKKFTLVELYFSRYRGFHFCGKKFLESL